MKYSCYVFESAQHVIDSINHFKQSGKDETELKILIKDFDHGRLLSASGIHHVDYLYEMTDTNHFLADQSHVERQPNHFVSVGFNNGQNTASFINGSFAYDDTNATEVLLAYGLSEQRAEDALKALRLGHYLLFVPHAYHASYARGHQLHDTLSASFGETVESSHTSDVDIGFPSALYEI